MNRIDFKAFLAGLFAVEPEPPSASEEPVDMDLFSVTTNELLVELMRRYDHALFAGFRDDETEPGRVCAVRQIRYKGNLTVCAGLAFAAAQAAAEEYDQTSTAIGTDGEEHSPEVE